jgi:predicted HAD superfamily Cof-like phosphohydrolase
MVEAVESDTRGLRVGEYPGSAGKKGLAGEVQMNSQQRMVKEFHHRFGEFIRSSPGLVDEATRELRIRLIREEMREFEKAAYDKNLVKIADALADLLYVIYGTGVSYGIDLEPIFREVHESNISKGDPNVLRTTNGKILKAKNWKPPDLQPILEKM